jgi:ribosomal-protein-alanine N-acetyltransferase
VEPFVELFGDVENRGPYFPQTLDSEATFLDRYNKNGFWSNERGMMLIVDNKTKRLLGHIAFFQPEFYYDAFEIGYIIYNPKDRGKGYTSQALELFVRYLFNWKNIFRLQIQLEHVNTGSRLVAEKTGFVREGTARQALIIRGKPVDLEVYSMTREDFDKRGSVGKQTRKKSR